MRNKALSLLLFFTLLLSTVTSAFAAGESDLGSDNQYESEILVQSDAEPPSAPASGTAAPSPEPQSPVSVDNQSDATPGVIPIAVREGYYFSYGNLYVAKTGDFERKYIQTKTENGQSFLDVRNEALVPGDTYEASISLNYYELASGDTVNYIETKTLTGSELMALSSWPIDEAAVDVKFDFGELNAFDNKKISYDVGFNRVTVFSVKSRVWTKPGTLGLTFMAAAKDGTAYYLTKTVDVSASTTVTVTEDDLSQAATLTLPSSLSYLSVRTIGQSDSFTNIGKLVITKGAYESLQTEVEEALENGVKRVFDWKVGDPTINASKTLSLSGSETLVFDSVNISEASQYAFANVILRKGDFVLENVYEKTDGGSYTNVAKGALSIKDEAGNTIAASNPASNSSWSSVNMPLTVKLQSGTYTVEYAVTYPGQAEPATVSREMIVRGMDTNEIHGLVVQAQDENGKPLINGQLELYVKQPYTTYAANWYEMPAYYTQQVFKSDLPSSDGQFFVPSAFLLAGKQYEVVVYRAGVPTSPDVIYHRTVTSADTDAVLNFNAAELKKVSFLTPEAPTGTLLTLDMIDADGTHLTWPYPLQLSGTETAVYLSTNRSLTAETHFVAAGDVGYDLSKNFTLTGNAQQSVDLKSNLVLLSAPSGYDNAKISPSYNAPYASKYYVSGTDDLYVTFSVDKDDYRYSFTRWLRDDYSDTQFSFDKNLKAEYEIETHSVFNDVYSDYMDSKSNWLKGVEDIATSAQVSAANGTSLFRVATEQGVENYSVERVGTEIRYAKLPASALAAPVSGQQSMLEYQLFDQQTNQPIGAPIYTNDMRHVKFEVPKEGGQFLLRLVKQNFPTDVVNLSGSIQVTAEAVSDDPNTPTGPITFDIVVPQGYVRDTQSPWNARGEIWSLNDQGKLSSTLYVNNDGTGKLTFNSTGSIQPDKSYVLNLVIPLRKSNDYVTYYRQLKVTGQQLLELGPVEPPAELALIQPQLKMAISSLSVQYLAPVEGVNIKYAINPGSSTTTGNQNWKLGSLLAVPGDYDVVLTGVGEFTKGYSIRKAIHVAPGSHEVTVTDYPQARKIELKNKAPFMQFVNMYTDEWSAIYAGYYIGSKQLLNEAYVTPGEQSFEFTTLEVAPQETPWLYNWRLPDTRDIQSDLTLNFTGEVDLNASSLQFQQYDDDYFAVFPKLVSGDVVLSGVQAVYDRYVPMGIAAAGESKPTVVYNNKFDYQNAVPGVVTMKDSQGKIVYTSQYQYWYSGLYINRAFDNGTYTLEFSLPFGPNQELKLSKQISIGAVDSVTISTPHADEATNQSSVTVTGVTQPGKPVKVELYQASSVKYTANVTADAGTGSYTATIPNVQEGVYAIVASRTDVSAVRSAPVTFTVDRTPPAKAVVQVASGAGGMTASWGAVEGAAKYKLFMGLKGGQLAQVGGDLTATSYKVTAFEAGKTYQFQVKTYDRAGNESVSDIKEFTAPDFAITSLEMTTEPGLSAYQLLIPGSKLKFQMAGSYEEGYQAEVGIVFDYPQGNTSNPTSTITMTYDSALKKYKGELTLPEGAVNVKSYTGRIVRTVDGAQEEVKAPNTTINRAVGAIVSGKLTVGGEALASVANLRLASFNTVVKVNTAADGSFKAEGIPAGKYTLDVTYDGATSYGVLKSVELSAGQKVLIPTAALDLPVYRQVKVRVVSKTDPTKAVPDGTYVEIRGKDNNPYYASGTVQNGEFVTWSGENVLKRVPSGKYAVHVWARGAFKDTDSEIDVLPKADHVATPIQVQVESVTKDMATVTLDFTIPQDVDIARADYVSLYSQKASEAFGYEAGGRYLTQAALTDGKIVLDNVVQADDYYFSVQINGYRLVYADRVDVAGTTATIPVTVDKGVQVTGVLGGGANALAKVYAYTASSYAYGQSGSDGAFDLRGLASGENIYLSVEAPGYLPIQQTIDVSAAAYQGKDVIDLGTIALQAEAFIHGKVLGKDGKTPVKQAYVYAYPKSSGLTSYGWARTDDSGYFKIRGLKAGDYRLETSAYGYPSVSQDQATSETETTIVLQPVGTGSFSGDGNGIAASVGTVVPGKTMQYRVNYKNNGTAKAEQVQIALTLPDGVTLVPNTAALNGVPVTVTGGAIAVGEVGAGVSGAATFEVHVASTASGTLVAGAKILFGQSEESSLMTSTTNVLFVTLNAPATTAQSRIKVYGNAKPGADVEIFDGSTRLAKVKSETKWWFADVVLPIADASEDSEHALTAVVSDGGEKFTSDIVSVAYMPNVPQLSDVTVHAGWNGDVKLNPYTGVATFALTEKTQMDSTVVFDQAVDRAYLTFLGEKYELTRSADGKTFTGGVSYGWSSYGEQVLEITFVKGDIQVTLPLMEIIVLIDPSGYVFEGSMSNKLEGVHAVVDQQDPNTSSWSPWNASLYGQVNPQTTDAEGKYGWDVIQGNWRVQFSKAGYDSYISRIVVVPPAETQLNVPMVRSAAPVVQTVTPAANAAEVATNSTIKVTFDRPMNQANIGSLVKVYKVEGDTETEVAGTIAFEDAMKGYKSDTSKLDDDLLDSQGESGWFVEDPTVNLFKTLVFTPGQALEAGKTYKVVVSAAIADYAGKGLDAEVSSSFTTKSSGSSDPDPGPGPGPIVNPGPGGGTPGANPTEPTEGSDKVAELAESDIPSAQNDKVTVDIQGKEGVTLPSSIITKLGNNQLEVKTQQGSVAIPQQVVKQLAGLVDASALADAKISLAIKPVEGATALVSIHAGANTNIKAVGPVYDLRLSITTKDGAVKTLSAFEAPITLRIQVGANADRRLTGIYYIAADGQLEYVGGTWDGNELVAEVTHFSQYGVLEVKKQFADVSTKYWAYNVIQEMAAKQIVSGIDEKTFAPEKKVTRAEFAVMVVNALKLKAKGPSTFTDVQSGKWYADEVAAAYENGILRGVGDGRFAPDKEITREEMAMMLVNAYKLLAKQDAQSRKIAFSDAGNISDWAHSAVEAAVGTGLMSGQKADTFAPKAATKRAEAVQALHNLLAAAHRI